MPCKPLAVYIHVFSILCNDGLNSVMYKTMSFASQKCDFKVPFSVM